MSYTVVLLLSGFALVYGCTDKGAGPGDTGLAPQEGEPEEGRVLLANQTIYVVETVYLNRVEEERPRIVRVQVEPGQTLDVSREILPPGLKVELDLVLLLPAELGPDLPTGAACARCEAVLLRLRSGAWGRGSPFLLP